MTMHAKAFSNNLIISSIPRIDVIECIESFKIQGLKLIVQEGHVELLNQRKLILSDNKKFLHKKLTAIHPNFSQKC